VVQVSTEEVRRDKDGYTLDEKGERVYPPWANAIPGGAKTSGAGKRPGWVAPWANAWDESKPPAGWFLIDGEWYSAADADAVKEHPELVEMASKQTKAVGIACPTCSKAFETANALRGHRIHCKE
jgi:hypothetical protein